MRNILFAAVVLVAAASCGSKRDEEPSQGPRGASAKFGWVTQERRQIEETVAGIPFTVSLPAGMRKDATSRPDVQLSWSMERFGPGVIIAPYFPPPTSIDDAAADARLTRSDVVARKEALDDGFLVTFHHAERTSAETRVHKASRDQGLRCRAFYPDEAEIPDLDGVTRALEEICRSLVIR
jgi:hypothetical protein